MNKLISFIISIILLIGFSFANSTGINTTITKSQLLSGVTITKQSLLNQLEQKNKSLIESATKIINNYNQELEYQALKSMGYISKDILTGNIMNSYFQYKQDLLKDYNSITSSLLILDEKLTYGLITQSSYNNELTQLDSDLKGYKVKYENLIQTFYNNFSGQIVTLQNDYNQYKVSKKDLLIKVKNNKIRIEALKTLYENFFSLVNKINGFYVNKYETIQTMVSELKTTTLNLFRISLIKNFDENLNNYEKLAYYKEETEKYILSLVDLYSISFDSSFQDLIKGFYTQEDYNYINTSYEQFKNTYYSGNNLLYSSLTGDGIDLYFQKFDTKLNGIINNMNDKLNQLSGSTDIESLKTVLKTKIQSVYDVQIKDKKNLLNQFLKQKTELLGYKLTSDMKEYNSFLQDVKKLNLLTGSNQIKYDYILQIQRLYKERITQIVDKQIKIDFTKTYWKLEIYKIDLLIKINGLIKYQIKYTNSLNTIIKVLENNSKKYTSIVLQNKFSDKLDQVNAKIDNMLLDNTISKEKKYLLLLIKKSIITFKYLQ